MARKKSRSALIFLLLITPYVFLSIGSPLLHHHDDEQANSLAQCHSACCTTIGQTASQVENEAINSIFIEEQTPHTVCGICLWLRNCASKYKIVFDLVPGLETTPFTEIKPFLYHGDILNLTQARAPPAV